MRRAEIAFPSLILGSALIFLALGNFFYAYSWTSFAFPLAVGTVLCALCAAEIVAVAAGRRHAVPRTGEGEPIPFSRPSLAWMLALAPFLYGLGFVLGPAAYLSVCLHANGFSWNVSLGVAAGSLLVTWGLFVKVLGVLLPIWPLWWP
jgi:hypothetical protein